MFTCICHLSPIFPEKSILTSNRWHHLDSNYPQWRLELMVRFWWPYDSRKKVTRPLFSAIGCCSWHGNHLIACISNLSHRVVISIAGVEIGNWLGGLTGRFPKPKMRYHMFDSVFGERHLYSVTVHDRPCKSRGQVIRYLRQYKIHETLLGTLFVSLWFLLTLNQYQWNNFHKKKTKKD